MDYISYFSDVYNLFYWKNVVEVVEWLCTPMVVKHPNREVKELTELQKRLDKKKITLVEYEEKRAEIDSATVYDR